MHTLLRGLGSALVLGCAMAGFSEAKAVVSFGICGIGDNEAGDLDPTVDIIQFTCVTGTGSLTGTAVRTNLPNYHKMVITNAELTGTGMSEVFGFYTLGNWTGPGFNRAWTIGEAIGQTGGGFSDANSHASTFTGPDAYAIALLAPGDSLFSAITTTKGDFTGHGKHEGTFSWDATAGSILWPDSGVFEIAVPEPATWAMMILGFGLSGLAVRRRRANRQVVSFAPD